MKLGQLKKHNNSQGISLIEVIIGVSILSLMVTMMLLTITLFLETRTEVMNKTKALYLAEEGVEILRYLRDEDWNTLSSELNPDTIYYLTTSAAEVGTTTSPEQIDSFFNRQFILREVYRDNSSDDVVASTTGSNYVDNDSLEVVMKVSFENTTTTVRAILANIFDI